MSTNVAIGDRIDSWKEIATYLERDVSTVIRWEKERGLPVHRIPGGQRQAVFAFKEELDAWLTGNQRQNGEEPAPVNRLAPNSLAPICSATAETETGSLDPLQATVVPAKAVAKLPTRRVRYWAAGLGVALLLLAISYRYLNFSVSLHAPQLQVQQQLTANGLEKWGLLTDGKTLYFGQEQDGRYALAAMSVDGGPVRVLWSPSANVVPLDVSPDGKKLLALTSVGVEVDQPLWVIPLITGEPRRLSNTNAHSASWAPDGNTIAYASGNAVYLTSEQMSSSREIGTFAATPRELMWSKDGKRLRFILDNVEAISERSWGEIYGDQMTMSTVRPLPIPEDGVAAPHWVRVPGWDAYIFLGAPQTPGGTPAWLGQLDEGWWEPSIHAIPMGSFLEGSAGIAPLERSRKLFVLSFPPYRVSFTRYDAHTQAFRIVLPGVSGRFLDYSRDGKWVAYVADDDHRLDISRADGSAARQIAFEPGLVELPRWSPNGKRIAFSAQRPGRSWRIYVFDLDSGMTKEATDGNDGQGAPTWSPDGRFLTYGGVVCEETKTCAVHRIDLATGKTQTLPDSEGLYTARWSPDGHFIAALHMARHQLMLFDVKARTWRKLADTIDGDDLSWSRDSKYLYVNVHGREAGIVRIRTSDGKREEVMEIGSEDKAGLAETDDLQFSLGPDDSVILHRRIHSEEIYSYDLRPR